MPRNTYYLTWNGINDLGYPVEGCPATEEADSEELARRQLVASLLGKGYQVRKVECQMARDGTTEGL